MIHYILQVVAFQLFFLLIYDLFLKRETFFNWNRIYLLATAVLSLILPFLKIQKLTAITQEQFVVKLPEVVIGATTSSGNPQIADYASINIEPEAISIWQIVLFSGMMVSVLILAVKIFRIVLLVKQSQKQWWQDLLIVKVLNSKVAFSFFNYVFLGDKLSKEESQTILSHESIHIKQGHSFDLMFFELLRIVLWFNPLVYMYQNRISTLHEYIADEKAVKFHNKNEYYNQLLGQVFETRQFSFVNPFFKKSLIKKRILMLSQAKSKQHNIFKYALLIPLVASMLFYVSCHKESLAENDPAISDLDQYTYSVEVGDFHNLTKEEKITINAFKNFLMTHPNYISWARIDSNKNTITYSIHSKDEEIPDGAKKVEFQTQKDKGFILISDFGKGGNSVVKIDESDLEISNGDIEVPFGVVDQVPTTAECADKFASNENRKKCVSDFIAKHVNLNFNTQLASNLGLTGKQRITVIFRVDTEGNVMQVRARAPHPGLEEEAVRAVKTLPRFTPGKHKGKEVVVLYSLPIIFQINTAPNNTANNKNQQQNLSEIPFSVVEEAPKFPGCESISSNDEAMECTSQKVAAFVDENFNKKLAKQNGLSGRQRISVIFKIDTQGNVINVRSRASSPVLEKEAIRVVGSLPQFTPGKHEGELITVPYSLPISFNVD